MVSKPPHSDDFDLIVITGDLVVSENPIANSIVLVLIRSLSLLLNPFVFGNHDNVYSLFEKGIFLAYGRGTGYNG